MNKDKKIFQEPSVVKVELDTKVFYEKLNEANNAVKKFRKEIENIISQKNDFEKEKHIRVLNEMLNELDPWDSKEISERIKTIEYMITVLENRKETAQEGKRIVECRDCEKFNIAIQIMKSLEWAPNDEGLSLLSFDEESKTIMIDEKSLMRIIQLANPAQQERKIKITSKKHKRSCSCRIQAF